jgi:hypothetical protein
MDISHLPCDFGHRMNSHSLWSTAMIITEENPVTLFSYYHCRSTQRMRVYPMIEITWEMNLYMKVLKYFALFLAILSIRVVLRAARIFCMYARLLASTVSSNARSANRLRRGCCCSR